MNKEAIKSLKDFKKIDIHCMLTGLSGEHYDNLKEIFEKTCYEHHEIFNDESFLTKTRDAILDYQDQNYLNYILPIIRRVYTGIFLDEKVKLNLILGNNLDKLELLKLKFDYLDILFYLKINIPKYVNTLDDLKYIDGIAEMCELISKNYINKLITEVRYSLDTKSEIRNIKIEKIIK